jgi:hypothetical protein
VRSGLDAVYVGAPENGASCQLQSIRQSGNQSCTEPDFWDVRSHFPTMYGPPSDCKEKAEGGKTSLRKARKKLRARRPVCANVFGLLVELSAPGQDELRAYLSL